MSAHLACHRVAGQEVKVRHVQKDGGHLRHAAQHMQAFSEQELFQTHMQQQLILQASGSSTIVKRAILTEHVYHIWNLLGQHKLAHLK